MGTAPVEVAGDDLAPYMMIALSSSELAALNAGEQVRRVFGSAGTVLIEGTGVVAPAGFTPVAE